MDDKEDSKRPGQRLRALVPRGGEKRSLLISLALLVVILAVLAVEYAPHSARFELGEPSPETVISSRQFKVVDEEATQAKRQAERDRVKRLFIDSGEQAAAVSRLGEFLAKVQELAGQEGDLAAKVAGLWGVGGQGMDVESLKRLLTLSEEDLLLLSTASVGLLNAVMSDPVSSDNLVVKKEGLRAQAEGLPLDEELKDDAAELAAAFLTTNTSYEEAIIARDMEAAANAVSDQTVDYAVGQKIVERGDIVTPLILASLQEAGELAYTGSYRQLLGVCLLALLVYASALYFMRRFRPALAGNWRAVAMICATMLAFATLARIFAFFADYNPAWGYLVPLAMVGLLASVLLDNLLAVFLVTVGTVLTALFLKGDPYQTVAALLGGVAGALAVRRIRGREDLIKAMAGVTLFVALACAISASIVGGLRFTAMAGMLGVANGVLSCVLTLGMLPLLERMAGMTTPMRLMELASPDHPLMRELISKAPGTYSHSVIVGNLASAAAQSIDADATLARVGAYYHDVGKIKRSSFFVENQPMGRDSHRNMKPNLSALVITAHVKEGVELAREYHLPQELVDIIRQHHGTSLVRYFYARALEEGGKEGLVPESRFRYPGEKPRSKEAALVMLADAVEAAAKAMEKPTPTRLEQLVRSLIRERMDDGQLSESNLTMGELDHVVDAFAHILAGMYHERVSYPVLVREESL